MLRKLSIGLTLLILSINIAIAATFSEGVEYIKIDKPVKTSNPEKVVVTEMYWYGCPHCFRFEPYLNKWIETMPEGVDIEKLHSVLNPGWMEHARASFALKMMGIEKKINPEIFKEIHLKRKRLGTVDEMASFVASHGVDEKQFREYYHSFPVDTLIRKSKTNERKYGHRGVPAVIINGKYRTSASQAGSNARMIEVIDYLVAKELEK